MVSGLASRQTTTLVPRSSFWFSGSIIAPPPVAMTACSFWQAWLSTLRSSCLNLSSPSCLKISGMVLPLSLTISSSVSMSVQFRCSATLWATTDLPVAEKPMMAILLFALRRGIVIARVGRTNIVFIGGYGFLQVVTAEFRQHGVCQDD